MSLVGTATRTAGRLSPWARAIAVAEIAFIVKRHVDKLAPGELGELRTLVSKSHGRPKNLTATERRRVIELAKKLEPGAFAKTAAMRAAPLRKR
ncbi:MAG: hypothetical protein M3Q53_04815 [Actinomycetota bacterium]|nr:hypothetical protein [Actinomycetota bacterium]